MFALQDLCEHALLANGIASRPKAEWGRLMESAKAHVKSIPLEFENSCAAPMRQLSWSADSRRSSRRYPFI